MKYLLALLLLCSTNAFGKLFLNVHLHNMKGIDKDLTLASDLHSREEVIDHERIIEVKMRNGIMARFQAELEVETQGDDYGPSETVLVRTEVVSHSGEILRRFDQGSHLVRLGETQKIVITKDDQTIEVTFAPEIR